MTTAAEVQAAIFAFGAASEGDPAADRRTTIDYFDFLQISPEPFSTPGDAFLVPSGMGNFIGSLADDLPVRLGTPVERIARTPEGVVVRTAEQSFRSKVVIVTASSTALASGAIEFQPALPAEYVEGFASLPLVACYKCLLGFRSATPFPDRFSILQPLVDGPTPAFFSRFWGTNDLEIIAGGDLARRLERNGTQNAITDLLARLEVSFPGCTAEFDGRILQRSAAGSVPRTNRSVAAGRRSGLVRRRGSRPRRSPQLHARRLPDRSQRGDRRAPCARRGPRGRGELTAASITADVRRSPLSVAWPGCIPQSRSRRANTVDRRCRDRRGPFV